MPILMSDCPGCDGGGKIVHSRHGYGAGDPFATLLDCEVCDGHGEVVRWCEYNGCEMGADEVVKFPDGDEQPYCTTHADEMRAEAVEEVLAGMTSWSRAVVLHHMRLWLTLDSGSREMSEIGREIEEDGCGEWFKLPRNLMAKIASDAA